MSRYRVAVDVGGTFTDLIVHDEETGAVAIGKTASIPADPAAAIMTALEQAEIAILNGYLPAAASDDEVAAAVAAAIAETGASSAKDMGKVMKAAMAALSGKTVDGKKVSEAVKAKLGG